MRKEILLKEKASVKYRFSHMFYACMIIDYNYCMTQKCRFLLGLREVLFQLRILVLNTIRIKTS